MKISIALLAVLGLIILTGVLDSPANWEDHEGVNLINDLAQDEEEASTQLAEEDVPALSSVEMVLEETTEDDGYIVEIYREFYTDEHGTVTKREPTDNYDYLRYKIDGEHDHDHDHDHE